METREHRLFPRVMWTEMVSKIWRLAAVKNHAERFEDVSEATKITNLQAHFLLSPSRYLINDPF